MAALAVEGEAPRMETSIRLRSTVRAALVGLLTLASVACADGDDRAIEAVRADRSRAIAAYREAQAVGHLLRDRNSSLRRAVRRLEQSNKRLEQKFTRLLKGLRSENRNLLSQVHSLEATLNALARSGYVRKAAR